MPNQELAVGAGIACKNGIKAQPRCRAPLIRVSSQLGGDCASRPLVHYGRSGRLESVHNAIEQGQAGCSGNPWSPNVRPKMYLGFGQTSMILKLQIAGLNAGYDETVLPRRPGYTQIRGLLFTVSAA